MPLPFESREEVLAWICKNQLGRRNLTPEQKKFLMGKQYCLDEEGHGLYSSPSYIVAIAAGDAIRYSNSFDYIGRIPTSLDLRFTDNPAMYSDDKVSQRSDFVVSDIHSSSSNAFYTISGTVINNSFKKQSVQVSAIFKQDGKIVGGKFCYSDPIEVGKSGSFTIYLPHTFENCDLYEVVATAY